MMDSDLPPGSCNSTGHLSTIGWNLSSGMHHSASTPAGVDGVGGCSRTPPATPKKGGKMLAIRVQMLDDSISMFQIQSKAFGKVLFDQVCRQLHLLEADYFGLEYVDAHGTRYWLDVEKPMCRQLGLSMLEPTLRFCVKFYTPDPARLEEEFTRYLFCLQVKRDLAQGCIHCNENTAALMASYVVQAECGDYVPEDYPDHTYLSGYKFFPGQDSESERKIMENHKKHIGQSPAEADLNLLETARRCELYGIKMHPAKDNDEVPLNLAVCHLGVVVFQHHTKINTFSWAKIRKISFKRRRFLIKLHPEGHGFFREVVEFFFDGRNECKNFWKKCVENHGFFRCSSAPKPYRHKPKVMSRGSSFRYSGKTQKQIVEFVRENYVKRQTFQRSGSFRARSAGSERRSALQPSVSAHPLLPLPPGSDAISLEWDQQPHYLEASLVMKGYSVEEAREMAARARPGTRASTRPNTRPNTRPSTPAAALAATANTLKRLYSTESASELVTHAEVNHHRMEDSPLPHRTMTPLDSPENMTWVLASPPGPPADSPEDATVSSASLCVSPSDRSMAAAAPLSASTPLATSTGAARKLTNGYDEHDAKEHNDDKVNGNVHVNAVVTQSTSSMDVLSGGEGEARDTLTRQNNNNVVSPKTKKDGTLDPGRKKSHDIEYFVAKELLMTERTYQRDLELITVRWSAVISQLSLSSSDAAALARACLAVGEVALPTGALLARLDKMLATSSSTEHGEPEYMKVSKILYDHLNTNFDVLSSYISMVGATTAVVESVRRRVALVRRSCDAFDAAAHVPLCAALLRPLHRAAAVHRLAAALASSPAATDAALAARGLAAELAAAAREQLYHVEHHITMCQLSRDIIDYDKILVADREFVRLGCVYKHSSMGIQQRMLFLFNDILVITSKWGSHEYKAHKVLVLHKLQLKNAELPHSFLLIGDDVNILISTSNDHEYSNWMSSLETTIQKAKENPIEVDTTLTPRQENGTDTSGTALTARIVGPLGSPGDSAAAVCWHRATSMSRADIHTALQTQLSGYLLRKFKKSSGWQRLWVVFARAALSFYKTARDAAPLAALPLHGYTLKKPAESDNIDKEFVFKLEYKTHVYFFRADSQYTYNRWTEVLQTAMVQTHKQT